MGGRSDGENTPPEKHYPQYTTHNDVWCSAGTVPIERRAASNRDYAYRARHAHPTGDVTPSNARDPLPGLLKGDRGFLAESTLSEAEGLGMTFSFHYA